MKRNLRRRQRSHVKLYVNQWARYVHDYAVQPSWGNSIVVERGDVLVPIRKARDGDGGMFKFYALLSKESFRLVKLNFYGTSLDGWKRVR